MIIKAPPHDRAQIHPMWHMYIHIKTIKAFFKKGSRHTNMEQLHSYLSLWATEQNPVELQMQQARLPWSFTGGSTKRHFPTTVYRLESTAACYLVAV